MTTPSPDDYGARSIELHRRIKGKLSVSSRVELATTDDLSLAYTPGVGAVSSAIGGDPALCYELTGRGNTIAVISDGSAVLGLGNLGPLGAMPVMEGKCVLFKELGGIDAIPLVLDTQDLEEIERTVRAVAPSFGGINLEDISAPRCFELEERLQDLGIPVFHDDQHGTSIVVLAAVLNALKVVGKSIEGVKIVVSGAGAGGIASAKMLLQAGAANMTLVDSQGAIYEGRSGLNPAKQEVARLTNREGASGSIHDAMENADVFIGLSAAGMLTRDDIARMASGAVVLAMANPVPEIMPDEAAAGGAAVIGSGRSDFPNQVNNVLAFPGVFRGALDVRATRVTNAMRLAAATALAAMVPSPTAGQILPSPLDRTVAPTVGKAVAEAWVA